MKYKVKTSRDEQDPICVFPVFIHIPFQLVITLYFCFFLRFTLASCPSACFSSFTCLLSELQQATKYCTSSAKESTNRQEIIFPLKSWLLSLLLTWQRFLLLRGQTEEVVHDYEYAHTQNTLCNGCLWCTQTSPSATNKACCWLLFFEGCSLDSHTITLCCLEGISKLRSSLNAQSWAVLQRRWCVHMHTETVWC